MTGIHRMRVIEEKSSFEIWYCDECGRKIKLHLPFRKETLSEGTDPKASHVMIKPPSPDIFLEGVDEGWE